MTTEKQNIANRENSKKSTGAKTEQGKQVVSANAVKHGVFCSRLVMPFESADEYGSLLDGLIQSLKPYGAIEQLLVEKIAVAMWRQLRLTRAESASIEMNRSVHQHSIKSQVKIITAGDNYEMLTAGELQPETDKDRDQVKWCKTVMKEFSDTLEDDHLNDIEHIKQAAEIYGQLEKEMKEERITNLQDYLSDMGQSLEDWVRELQEWCEKEVNKAAKRSANLKALEIVQAKESAPISNQLLSRYQVGLDNELYKALEALRKQQQWRLQTSEVIEAEAV